MNPPSFFRRLFGAALLASVFTLTRPAHAQWQTQSVTLKPGWNAVYLHVDASHILLDDLINIVGNPITEVWLWQPPSSTIQFFDTPQQPSAPNSQWAMWNRSPVIADSLVRLPGNSAYLVRNTNTVDYVWTIKGKPVPPRSDWTSSGQNFIGFSTPAGSPPTFQDFLTPAPSNLLSKAEIYRYIGGELTNNPAKINPLVYRSVPVARNEAYWIRAGTNFYNRYFGPVELSLQNPAGVLFGDNSGTYAVRLKNLTANPVTITLNLVSSEAPPSLQPALVGGNTPTPPPLLVRGTLNLTNLTYTHTALAGQQSFTLAAQGQVGSELEVVLGLNRSAMTASTGSTYAGILRFADTGGLSQMDLPVSATVADASGLWVGQASVTQVGQYLKTYQKDANGNPVLAPVTTNGAPYIALATNTALGSVARPFPLRLILHHDPAAGAVNLLQRVFVGLGPVTNLVVATRESLLNPSLISSARRISATHLPFSATNSYWPKTSGAFQLGSNLVFNVSLDYNDHASNPFLHTFHPDHDNLKQPDFKTVQPLGVESYTVTRRITLGFTAPANDFTSLTASTRSFGGNYTEVITFFGFDGQAREFTLAGIFALNRISPISTLTKN